MHQKSAHASISAWGVKVMTLGAVSRSATARKPDQPGARGESRAARAKTTPQVASR